MSDKFIENRKFLGLNGVLGRRDFIINCVIIDLLECLFVLTPLFYGVIFNSDISSILLSNSKPLWYSITLVIVGFISCGLYFPSIVRRVRDILAEEDNNRVFVISSVLTVLIFMGYTPVGITSFGGWLVFFTLLSLMFWKGRITGEKPKSEIIKFNWGAFWGTWIWGLINKTPKALLMLPLLFTVGWFPFMILCGLKGNEWAYEKNKEHVKDVESFHDFQIKQSVILTFAAPIISLFCFMGLSVVSGSMLVKYSKSHPEFNKKIERFYRNYQKSTVENSFEKIELTDNEYKFYLDPEDWTDVSDVIRVSAFKSAVAYTLISKDKNFLSIKDFVDSVEEINKVKIYSIFNNEILGEFYVEPKAIRELYKNTKETDKNLKEVKKQWEQGYKFNPTPSLP